MVLKFRERSKVSVCFVIVVVVFWFCIFTKSEWILIIQQLSGSDKVKKKRRLTPGSFKLCKKKQKTKTNKKTRIFYLASFKFTKLKKKKKKKKYHVFVCSVFVIFWVQQHLTERLTQLAVKTIETVT